jgi:hypothetical protein
MLKIVCDSMHVIIISHVKFGSCRNIGIRLGSGLYAVKNITAYLLLKMNGPDLRVANLRRNVGLRIQNLNVVFFFFKK